MPGKNLTRDEARRRAELLEVESYRVSLDLGNAADLSAPTFTYTSTIRFACAEPVLCSSSAAMPAMSGAVADVPPLSRNWN